MRLIEKKVYIYAFSLAVSLLIFGVFSNYPPPYSKLADLAINLGSSLMGSAATVGFLQFLYDKEKKQLKKEFLRFFGETAVNNNFRLVLSRRHLSDEHTKLFEYLYHNELFKYHDKSPKNNKDKILETTPIPEGVEGWLAYDDILVATKLGRLFGTMLPDRQLEISLDDKSNSWINEPTIAVGLGFTLHTRDLLQSTSLNNLSLGWEESGDTDYFKFKTKKYDKDFAKKNIDYAIIVRIRCNGDHCHFICAGRSAAGTAAAGRYLADNWEEMLKLYDDEKKDLKNTSIAVLISHPKGFQQVLSSRKTEIRKIDYSFSS